MFVSAWKDTNNYKTWVCNYCDSIKEISPCHPFARQLSVADMKLKLSQLVLFCNVIINVIFQRSVPSFTIFSTVHYSTAKVVEN